MKSANVLYLLLCLNFSSCGQAEEKAAGAHPVAAKPETAQIPDSSGNTIATRFDPPTGYKRISCADSSFGHFLRNLPLKPPNSSVFYFDGQPKMNEVYDAVVDMDFGKRDLQQCADAVIRLRGEYLFSRKDYSKISFPFTSGFNAEFSEWTKGNRIFVNGNKATWKKQAEPSCTYSDFRKYMDIVFTYAGTLSLSRSLHPRKLSDLSVGDVFIVGGSPGHAVLVVDAATDAAGRKVFLLAQSYMPAQDIQILKNFENRELSPWYLAGETEKLATPEWTFTWDQLKTFDE